MIEARPSWHSCEVSARAPVNTRLWNLAAGGAVVLAGCGPGRGPLTLNEEPDTGESASSVADSVAETDDETGGCQTSADCPTGYSCVGGTCYYEGYDDGHPWYECYGDYGCSTFELCEYGYCEPAGPLPIPVCGEPVAEIPTMLDDAGEPLALRFANLDDDGQDELVVVRTDGIRVHEAGVGAPIDSASEAGAVLTDVALGQLDDAPGDDLLILIGDAQQLYSSLGDGSFAAPTSEAGPAIGTVGVRLGDFDGVPPLDRLVFGSGGAKLMLGDGQIIDVPEALDPSGAAVFDRAFTPGGYVLGARDQTWMYDLDHQLFAWTLDAAADGPLTPVLVNDQPHYLRTRWASDWTWFEHRELYGVVQPDRLFSSRVHATAPGDLDGDQIEDLVLLDASGWLAVWYQPFADGECFEWHISELDGTIVAIAVGDHDGDGDDEIAVQTTIAQIALMSP